MSDSNPDRRYLEVLVSRVFADPVRVEDAKGAAVTTDTLFGDGLESSRKLDEDTLVHRFAHGRSLWHGLLATTTSHSDSEWLCSRGDVPSPDELASTRGGWCSGFCTAKRESAASSASFPIASCARFRSCTCMRPYFSSLLDNRNRTQKWDESPCTLR